MKRRREDGGREGGGKEGTVAFKIERRCLPRHIRRNENGDGEDEEEEEGEEEERGCTCCYSKSRSAEQLLTGFSREA